MRIAIDGVQSTGKTTLLDELRVTFGNRASYVAEAARILAPSFGVHHASDWAKLISSPERLHNFFRAELAWLRESTVSDGIVIVDSSEYLVCAYAAVLLSDARFGAILESTRYDLILYCPTSVLPVEDNFRFLNHRTTIAAYY